jgi:hypothetical protein
MHVSILNAKPVGELWKRFERKVWEVHLENAKFVNILNIISLVYWRQKQFSPDLWEAILEPGSSLSEEYIAKLLFRSCRASWNKYENPCWTFWTWFTSSLWYIY